MKTLFYGLIILMVMTGCSSNYYVQKQADPCKDKYLVQLEQKSSLTPEEMIAYAQLKRNCLENENSKNQTEIMELQADMIHLGVMVYVSTIIGVLIWAATK